MSLIDLYVRDKYSGKIHKVGDNQHDMLAIGTDGQLHYMNLQNGDGCSAQRSGGYEFVPNMDDHGFNADPREMER